MRTEEAGRMLVYLRHPYLAIEPICTRYLFCTRRELERTYSSLDLSAALGVLQLTDAESPALTQQNYTSQKVKRNGKQASL